MSSKFIHRTFDLGARRQPFRDPKTKSKYFLSIRLLKVKSILLKSQQILTEYIVPSDISQRLEENQMD
jgi:hypothetical protein